MKRFFKWLAVLLILLIIYALYICATTGFFRTVSNTYQGSTIHVAVPGAEDFAISRSDGFLIISSDDRAGRRDGKETINGLYYMDVNDEQPNPQLLKAVNDVPLFPHGISMLQLDSNTYRLLVVNHVTSSTEAVSSMDPNTVHSIEEYIYRDSVLIHVKTHKDELMNSPNDVVAVDDKGFYFTNDHGSKTKLGLILEDFLGFRRSNVVYFNGVDYKIVDTDIAYANGINIDHDKNIIYVASPRDMMVKVYDINLDGTLDFQVDIDCNSGVDNIEIDESGLVWIGSHPKLLTSTTYFAGSSPHSPSEIITIDYNNKDDYSYASVYESDGTDMSASTVAIPYKNKVYLGNVMDDHFIILEKDELH